MSETAITGACHCGNVQYQARVNKQQAHICHCRDCQVLSGSAFRVSIPVVQADFKLLSGKLKTYVKIAASGNQRAQCFCDNCGTQIYATCHSQSRTKIYNLRVGTIHQNQDIVPSTQLWSQSALPWVQFIADIKAFTRAKNG